MWKGGEHPSQCLLDMMTIVEEFGEIMEEIMIMEI